VAKELTALAIEKIKPGPTRLEIPDGRISGLYFVIQPSGKRSWAVRYRLKGKPCKFTIDSYPALDLKAARARADEITDRVKEGRDPGAEKKAIKGAAAVPANDLVETVTARFLSHYAARQLKAGTAREVERLLEKEIVEPWRGRRLSQIGRADIHDLLDFIIDRGSPITANRTLAWFRRTCSWAIERGLIENNPCAAIKAPAAETARDRVLNDDELAAVWRAAEATEQPYREFVKMLILTGQRRNEVAEMCWAELDLDARLWVLPKERAKNQRAHTIPLSDHAVELLKGLSPIADSNFVFTLNGRNRITAFHLTKGRLDAALPRGMEPWKIHDLRRTFASGCARLGIAVHVVEAALNHRSGMIKGVAAVYNRYSYDAEKRAAMTAWARHVEAIVSGEMAANVVELAKNMRG
jgi:integrase